jgi:long-subunit fatty acid transport protein
MTEVKSMKTKNKIIVLIIVSLCVIPVSAQDFAPVGTAVAQFLEIGMGARGTAMGQAYTAMTDDAGSVFWNPAGLTQLDQRELYLAYTSWPADISVGGLVFGWNLESIGTVAVNALYLDTDDMAVTTVFDPEGLSGEVFSITNYAIGVSFARNMTDQLSVGATFKLVREDYLGYGYNSWAVDLGTVYRTGFNGLNIGMSIMHFGPEIKFDGTYIDYSDNQSVEFEEEREFENYSLPVMFRFGLTYDIINQETNDLIVAADMVHPNNNLEQYNLGLEYGFRRMFFVRGGYQFNTDQAGLCLGLGIKYGLSNDLNLQLDYAYSDLGVLTDIHRFSFGFGF